MHRDSQKLLCVYTDASDQIWSGVMTQMPRKALSRAHVNRRHVPLEFLSGQFTNCQFWSSILERRFLLPWKQLSDFIGQSALPTDSTHAQVITILSYCLTLCHSFLTSCKPLCARQCVGPSSLARTTMCVSTLRGRITSGLTYLVFGMLFQLCFLFPRFPNYHGRTRLTLAGLPAVSQVQCGHY